MAFNSVLRWPNTGGCFVISVVLDSSGGGGDGTGKGIVVSGGWDIVGGKKLDAYKGGIDGGGAIYGACAAIYGACAIEIWGTMEYLEP